MYKFILSIASLFCVAILSESCGTRRDLRPLVKSVILQKNVYKTRVPLLVKKAYYNGSPATDLRDFYIMPNSEYYKRQGTIQTVSLSNGVSQVTTTTETTSVPPVTTETKVEVIPDPITYPLASVTAEKSNNTSSRIVYYDAEGFSTDFFLRYTVVLDEGDNKYIRLLPCTQFSTSTPTNIEFSNSCNASPNPSDFIFQVAKKDLLPASHYLASSALIGKLVTLPVRVRKQYWSDNNTEIQGAFSAGVTFGYRIKLGNNPYKTKYISIIPYGAGISQQKYFRVLPDAGNKISEKSDEFAVTYYTGGIAWEFDKFNIGLFLGKDKMFGSLRDWAYQDKWWWGIGIGYDIFK